MTNRKLYNIHTIYHRKTAIPSASVKHLSIGYQQPHSQDLRLHCLQYKICTEVLVHLASLDTGRHIIFVTPSTYSYSKYRRIAEISTNPLAGEFNVIISFFFVTCANYTLSQHYGLQATLYNDISSYKGTSFQQCYINARLKLKLQLLFCSLSITWQFQGERSLQHTDATDTSKTRELFFLAYRFYVK